MSARRGFRATVDAQTCRLTWILPAPISLLNRRGLCLLLETRISERRS